MAKRVYICRDDREHAPYEVHNEEPTYDAPYWYEATHCTSMAIFTEEEFSTFSTIEVKRGRCVIDDITGKTELTRVYGHVVYPIGFSPFECDARESIRYYRRKAIASLSELRPWREGDGPYDITLAPKSDN